MRDGGGKAKGSEFERSICKKLSLWISNNQQEDIFWRSAISGGRSTVAAKSGKRLAAQSGDISCIHPCGHAFAEAFFMECKFYSDLNYQGLLTGKGNLIKFWLEATTQAAVYSKLPFMIAKQNQLPVTACLTRAGFERFVIRGRQARVSSPWLVSLAAPQSDLYIMLFDEFLKMKFVP